MEYTYSRGLECPQDRVSARTKEKASWYQKRIDYVIAQATACNDREEVLEKYRILKGDIPNKYYKKTLNPYNSQNGKNRFPATMRNLDIINDSLRRYISEYIKAKHDFIVGNGNTDIMLQKEVKLRQEMETQAQELYMAQFQQALAQAMEEGQSEEEIDIESLMPPWEEFVADFNEKYIDDITIQGQELLKIIDDKTNSDLIYSSCYKDYVAFGECYTYRTVRGNTFVKEHVPVHEAYPVPNSNFFVKDYESFARLQRLSLNQILDLYEDDLSEKDKTFLKKYYIGKERVGAEALTWAKYLETYSDADGKYSQEEKDSLAQQPTLNIDLNGDLIDVWHVNFLTYAKTGILTYVNEMQMIDTMKVDEDFEFDKEQGHISIEWVWEKQVREGIRIGGRTSGIYPIKARPVPYSLEGCLQYNGLMELLPGMGRFSIIDTVLPFQILRNIFSYHREIAISKNKLYALVMPKSILGKDIETELYRLMADGILLADDSTGDAVSKLSGIRMLEADISNYIINLGNIIESIKNEARETIDMTPQRYGEIAHNAGKGTTEEAIIRGSMGTVIITYMFDKFREADYNIDMDYTKFAWVDGLDTAYLDGQDVKYFSLDVNSHIHSRYLIKAKFSEKEEEKLSALKDWAFAAQQNGELQPALEAIEADNIAMVKRNIQKFEQMKQANEESLRQMDAQNEERKLEIQKEIIAAEGEEERKTLILKYELEAGRLGAEQEFEAMMSDITSTGGQKANIDGAQDARRLDIENRKVDLEREKLDSDNMNARLKAATEIYKADTDLKVAKENKNQYDNPKR